MRWACGRRSPARLEAELFFADQLRNALIDDGIGVLRAAFDGASEPFELSLETFDFEFSPLLPRLEVLLDRLLQLGAEFVAEPAFRRRS